MTTPKFVHRIDVRAKEYKANLWERSDNSLSEVKNPKLNYFIRASLIVAFVTTLISGFLVIREYAKGDYPVYSSHQRIGAICADGWKSKATGQGACSHHGGVDRWIYRKIGYHYQNPQPYWTTLVSAISIMLLLSIFSTAFRRTFIASLSEAFYRFGLILYIILFISAIPFYILYSLYRRLTIKNEKG